MVLAAGPAGAQATNPATPQPSPESPAAPPAAPQGFIDVFGAWVQQGVTSMGSGVGAAAKGAADAASTVAKGAADVARDTAASVTKLPAASVIGGRERCIIAPNGAPDCRAAAEAICQAKGYAGGTTVDFESAQKCPPNYRVSSRNPAPEGVCTMEHFVTRVFCQ